MNVNEACRILTEIGYKIAVCKSDARIVLDHMQQDPDHVEVGTTGTICALDGADNIMIDWDNERKLYLIPFVDRWHVI